MFNRLRNMEGRLFWVLAGAGLLLALAFILGANIQRSSAEPAPSNLRTAQVVRGDIEEAVRANGQVTARGTDLTFQASGVISDVLVKPGSVVQAGQVLARLDTRQAEANLAGKVAAQKSAQARLEDVRTGPANQLVSAQQDLKVAQAKLDQVKTGNASKEQLDAAQEEVNAAVFRYNDLVSRPNPADVQAAEARVRAAQANLNNVNAGPSAAKLKEAQNNLDAAKQNLEKVKTQQAGLVDQADLALQKATKARDAAKDTYNQIHNDLYNPDGTPKKTPTAQDQQRDKDAKNALDQAELSVTAAQKALDSAKAQQTSAVNQAQAQVNSTEAALEDLQSGPSEQAKLNAQAQLDTANAQLAQARQPATQDEVNAAQAEINQARAKQGALTKGGSDKDVAVAQAEVDKYQQLVDSLSKGAPASQLSAAQGDLERATAEVQQAQLVIEQADLKAPFNSVVENVFVTPGQTAAPGTAAFSLVDLSGLSVEARVGQASIQRIKSGQPIRMTFQGISGVRNEPFGGTVTFVSFQAKGSPSATPDPLSLQSRLTPASSGQAVMPTLDAGYPVTIVLDSDKQMRSLKPGMIGQVTIVLARKTEVLIVPKIAVRTVPAGNVVDVMLADGQLVATPIKAGLANDDYVELTDNTLLREGDKIVLHADTPLPPLATPTPVGTPGKTPVGTPGTLTPGGTSSGSNSTPEVSPTPTFQDALALTPAATPTPIQMPATTGGPDINQPAQSGTVVIITQGAPSPPVSPTGSSIVSLPPTFTPKGTAKS